MKEGIKVRSANLPNLYKDIEGIQEVETPSYKNNYITNGLAEECRKSLFTSEL